MGLGLAQNLHDHGYCVFGYDPDATARENLNNSGGGLAFKNVMSMLVDMPSPRILLLLIPTGELIDEQLHELLGLLECGDIVVDCGNSHYRSTEKRQRLSENAGISFIGLGVSGGEQGARYGPSFMAGGDNKAINQISNILQRIAAKSSDGSSCLVLTGSGGSGHFVKMIHNGIEYAYMQLIAEAYYLLRNIGGLSPASISAIFSVWNGGALGSYLLEISSKVLNEIDEVTSRPLVDVILDSADQKGTGCWAAAAALEYNVPAPTIAEAVHARCLSTLCDERSHLAKNRSSNVLKVPLEVDIDRLIDAIHAALLGGKICSYAQGFSVIAAANRKECWSIDLASVSNAWTGGCIIRSRLLDHATDAFTAFPDLKNLLCSMPFSEMLNSCDDGWRQTVTMAVKYRFPVPAMLSALTYWDGYYSERLWADLIQGQRDYFGHHGFYRADTPGKHHHRWSDIA